MARFLDLPPGADVSLTPSVLLTPQEQSALAQAPQRDGWTDAQYGAVEGLSGYAGLNALRAAQARLRYVDAVNRLDPTASDERSALKAAGRAATPALERTMIERWRPGTGAPAGTGGSANHANPGVTEQARALGRLGHATLVGSALLDAAEVAGADDRARALGSVAGGEAGGWAGGIGGAELGAAIGAAGTPAGAIAGAAIGGVLGSLGGGVVGHRLGGDAVDAWRRR